MDHTVVHFEIPADDPERAAKFYRELFGWEIKHMGGPMDYWLVRRSPPMARACPSAGCQRRAHAADDAGAGAGELHRGG